MLSMFRSLTRIEYGESRERSALSTAVRIGSRFGAMFTAVNLTASSLNAWLRLFGTRRSNQSVPTLRDQVARVVGRDRVVDRRRDEDVLGLGRERREILERLLLHLDVDGVVGLPRRDQRDARVDLAGDAAERAHHADVTGIDLREAEEHGREQEDAARDADRQEPLRTIGVALDVDAIGSGIAVEDEAEPTPTAITQTMAMKIQNIAAPRIDDHARRAPRHRRRAQISAVSALCRPPRPAS